MAWIELHQSLPTHHRTMALMDALDIDVACAVGHLACLWLWALDNAPDGIITGSARSIARAAHWLGDPQQLVSGLQAAGFLDGDGRLHDWDDYAGRLLERRDREREQTRIRVQEWRKRQQEAPINGSNAVTNALRNAPVTPSNAPTQPYPTQQNQPFPPSGGAPDADAPDATPAKTRAVSAAPKPKGQSFEPLADAFIALGMAFPACKGREVQAAQDLLKRGTPDEIAACWQDVVTGDYGDFFDQKRLSFAHLAASRFLENWRGQHNGTYRAPKRPAAPEKPTSYQRAKAGLERGLDDVFRAGAARQHEPIDGELPRVLPG